MHEQYQAPLPVNSPALPEPFYYLHNFRAVLAWIGERYADLLDDQERAFIAAFAELPEASQALLVRMVMRKGTLAYAEIGDTRAAVQPLLALGWVDAQPTLELAQLFGLLKKDELSQLFRDHLGRANLRKDALLERLQPLFPEARRLAEWQADFAEPVYELRCMALCDRLRLMYFGNLWQDWSEFVLADLGIYRYESVEFSADSRGFRLRADVDAYLHLFDCRQRFDLGEPLEELLAGLPGEPYANPWLEGRRVKLLFQFAQHCEKQRDFDLAQRLYRQSSHPGARLRAIRSLERGERFAEAHALAREASCAPESDAERQGLARLLPRLQGKLGLPRQARAAAPEIDRLDLCLAYPSEPCSVEWAVREHLEEPDCAVHYVENGLINSSPPFPGRSSIPSTARRRTCTAPTSASAAPPCSRPAWDGWRTAATATRSAVATATSSACSRPSSTGNCLARNCSNRRSIACRRPTCAPGSNACWRISRATAPACRT